MKKILLITIFLFTCFAVQAQTYTIPNASKQPAWVFPLWFENGDGQKDTVYMGYDTNANDFNWGITSDSIFGEKWQIMDTSIFNIFIITKNFNDTVGKTNIVHDQHWGNSIFSFKAIPPLKISWDVQLFRSDSLPYLKIGSNPRAEGVFSFDLPSSIPGCSYQYPILLTDTAEPLTCHRKDSLIIYNGFGNMSLSIRKWYGSINSIDAVSENKSSFNIYPTIVNSTVAISNPYNKTAQLIITNLSGQNKVREEINSEQTVVDLSSLPNGFYIATVITTDSKFYFKLIKQ